MCIRDRYSSSKKEVAITMAELRPTFMPSLLTKNIAILVPPMADGVTADVNSHRKIIRKDCNQLRRSPERTRMPFFLLAVTLKSNQDRE